MPVPNALLLALARKAGLELFDAAKAQVRERQRAKAQQAFDDLLQQVAIVVKTDLEGAAARVDAMLREAEPETAETVFEHFRCYMDALDPGRPPVHRADDSVVSQ